jgi:hypothetical protein
VGEPDPEQAEQNKKSPDRTRAKLGAVRDMGVLSSLTPIKKDE